MESIVGGDGGGGVECRLYHPITGLYTNSHGSYQEKEYDLEERRLLTIGTFINNIPQSFIWQSRSMRRLEGFLYGQADHKGKMTGNKVTFIYPDLLTGLRGSFVNGVLQSARAVDIVGERCTGGMKELKLRASTTNSDIVWNKVVTNDTFVGQHPRIMDPHERKSVYVGASRIDGAGEGLFARRIFSPGDLVSYYSGHKTYLSKIIDKQRMTHQQIVDAASYLYWIGQQAPTWWDYSRDLLLNIGDKYRATNNYRTTLAHKANHDFSDTNVVWDIIDHPVVGGIACLVAAKEIDEDDEIYVDYNYDVEDVVPEWYTDAFNTIVMESSLREKYPEYWK